MIIVMAQGLLSRRWLVAWLIVLAYMAAVAYHARAQSLSALSSQIAQQLKPYAEQAIEYKRGNYWQNDYLWDCQGPMVYLIERGFRNPEMLRVMLLCEARRCYNQVYLYERCYNWDLRVHLLEESTRAFPDDPLVRWAAGRCLLTGGEYSRAADELLAAERLGFVPEDAGVKPKYFIGRIETALLMANRAEEIVERTRAELAAEPSSAEARLALADLLTRLSRYDESDAVLADWPDAAEKGAAMERDVLLMRNTWWRRDLGDFKRRVTALGRWRQAFSTTPAGSVNWLDWAEVRLEMLAGHFDAARAMAGSRDEIYMRALAEVHAFTGSKEALRRIREEVQVYTARSAELDNAYDRWDERRRSGERLELAQSSLVRAHMLQGDWEAVTAIMAEQERSDYSYGVNRTYEFAMLAAHIAVDYQFEKPWHWYPIRSRLPWLLYSDVFNHAAAKGGYDASNARQLVLADLAVERENYYDYSNGNLDW